MIEEHPKGASLLLNLLDILGWAFPMANIQTQCLTASKLLAAEADAQPALRLYRARSEAFLKQDCHLVKNSQVSLRLLRDLREDCKQPLVSCTLQHGNSDHALQLLSKKVLLELTELCTALLP